MRTILPALIIMAAATVGSAQSATPAPSPTPPAEVYDIGNPARPALPIPTAPRLPMKNALRLAERFIRKQRIDVSSLYLSEAKLAFCEVRSFEPCWQFDWSHPQGHVILNVHILVSMDGQVTRKLNAFHQRPK